MKIRYKLVALFLLVIISTLLPVSVFIINRMEDGIRERILRKAGIDAKILAQSTLQNLMMNAGNIATAKVDCQEMIATLQPFTAEGMVYADSILLTSKDELNGLVLSSVRDNALSPGAFPELYKIDAKEVDRLKGIPPEYREFNPPGMKDGFFEVVALGELPGTPPLCMGRLIYSKQTMLAPVRRMSRVITAAMAFALLLAGALGLVFSRIISKPIEALIAGARKIEGGELDQTVPVSTSDELGTLAGSFNRMAKNLDLKIAELEALNIELSRIDALKDEFLANTSHELRTPIAGIVGIAESLIEGAAGPPDPRAVHNLSMIVTSGRRLAHLINDILDLSRLKNDAMELVPEPVDMHTIVQLTLSMVRPMAENRSLEIRNLIAPGAAVVRGDENRLQQIMLNLLDNAVKFTEAGEISVRAEMNPEYRGQVVISVTDTGIGIPADKQERIFLSFEQADGSTARRYGGAGLGLAITKRLVERHGGKIGVSSIPGKGSRFYITLPLCGKQDDAAASAARKTGNAAITAAVREHYGQTAGLMNAAMPHLAEGAERILIVDDEPVNLQVLINFLSLAGYRVDVARSGPDALKEIGQNAPDMVLLDVMMPVMSGYDVCRALRKKYSPYELPILMLTAKRAIDDVIVGFESGANDYITKPFNRNELLARVNNLIALKRAVADHNQLSMIQRELTIAHQIQTTLLPMDLPNIGGLNIMACYKPASTLGGDFYDFHHIGENRLGVLIADVSGHGTPAAIISAMLKVAFSMHRVDGDRSDVLLTGINTALLKNTRDQFITACYAFIDTAEMTMQVSNAGHWPVLVWKRSAQELQEVRARGRALGILPGLPYGRAETGLARGDRIILFTDGVLECHNSKGIMFGEDSFHRLIKLGQDLPPGEFIEYVMESVSSWSGLSRQENQEDDITMIVIDVV